MLFTFDTASVSHLSLTCMSMPHLSSILQTTSIPAGVLHHSLILSVFKVMPNFMLSKPALPSDFSVFFSGAILFTNLQPWNTYNKLFIPRSGILLLSYKYCLLPLCC